MHQRFDCRTTSGTLLVNQYYASDATTGTSLMEKQAQLPNCIRPIFEAKISQGPTICCWLACHWLIELALAVKTCELYSFTTWENAGTLLNSFNI